MLSSGTDHLLAHQSRVFFGVRLASAKAVFSSPLENGPTVTSSLPLLQVNQVPAKSEIKVKASPSGSVSSMKLMGSPLTRWSDFDVLLERFVAVDVAVWKRSDRLVGFEGCASKVTRRGLETGQQELVEHLATRMAVQPFAL